MRGILSRILKKLSPNKTFFSLQISSPSRYSSTFHIRWDSDNLGDTCEHVYSVKFPSPLRVVSALVLFDPDLLRFLCGRSMYPYRSEPYFTPESLPFRLRPFQSSFKISNLLADVEDGGRKWMGEWVATYVCECEEPLSLFCQSLAATLTMEWHAKLTAYPIAENPFPIHFDQYVRKRCTHCFRCHGRPPIEIIDGVINLFVYSSKPFAKIEVVDGHIRIALPRSHRDYTLIPCFLRLMQKFPYPVITVFL